MKKEELKELNELLRRKKEIINHILLWIETELQNTPMMKGVHQISSSVKCCTVSFSLLYESKNFSPEFYMNEFQVKKILEVLNTNKYDIFWIKKKINDIIKTQKIKRSVNDIIYLNPNILNTLKKIEFELNILEESEEI